MLQKNFNNGEENEVCRRVGCGSRELLHACGKWFDRVLKTIAIAALLLYSCPIAEAKVAPRKSQHQCLASAIYYEAVGESLKTQRAVVDVILHRAVDSQQTLCEVVKEPYQFSWYRKKGIKAYDEDQKELLAAALQQGRVLKDKNFKFFYSGKKPQWALDMACKPIGKLTFCKERSRQGLKGF